MKISNDVSRNVLKKKTYEPRTFTNRWKAQLCPNVLRPRLQYLPGPLISANFPADCTRSGNESKHLRDNAQQPSNSDQPSRATAHHTSRRRKERVETRCVTLPEEEDPLKSSQSFPRGSNAISSKQLSAATKSRFSKPISTNKEEFLRRDSQLCLCFSFVSKIILHSLAESGETKSRVGRCLLFQFERTPPHLTETVGRWRWRNAEERFSIGRNRYVVVFVKIYWHVALASVTRANNARGRGSLACQ